MPRLFMGALKKVGIIIAGIVGAVVVLGVIGLLVLSAAVNSVTSADDLRFSLMTPDERQDELRAMLAGERGINCEFLSDADVHARDMLSLGALGGLSGAEMKLWRDVRNLHSAVC